MWLEVGPFRHRWWQLDREPRLLNFMERRIHPHRAVKWSSSVVAEPADSTFNRNLGLNLSTKTTESEDTNMEEEEKWSRTKTTK